MKPHEKVLNKLKEGESKAIRDYRKESKVFKGKPKSTLRRIEKDEEEHLRELKNPHD